MTIADFSNSPWASPVVLKENSKFSCEHHRRRGLACSIWQVKIHAAINEGRHGQERHHDHFGVCNAPAIFKRLILSVQSLL